MRRRRWHGAILATVAFAVAGVVGQRPVLVLAAAIPLVAVAAGSLSTTVDPEALTARRTLDPSPAPPGRPVAVTLTVTNSTERTLSDVRVVDGVPEPLAVTGGTPRAGTTLEPGESVSVRYAVVARRGEYDFAPPTVTIRGLGAGAVAERRPAVGGDATLVGRLDADAPPIEETGAGRVGQLRTDSPGEGVAFHSTREYEHGDAAGRIDWRHYAKRDELTTVEYERRVAATVVLVLDARPVNRVAAGPGRPTAVELSAYAATQALAELLGANHDVGVAIVGLSGPDAEGLYWLPPGGGTAQRARASDIFGVACDAQSRATHPAQQCKRLLDLAPPGAQFAFFSPLLDDFPVSAVETWLAGERPVALLSPDVVTSATLGGRQAGVDRRTRLARCQRAGARPVDWRRGTPLAMVLEEAFAVDAKVSKTRRQGGTAGGSP